MNIAFVLWPISQEGGLATRTAAFVQVARECGHRADFIRLAYTGHRKHSPEGVEVTASGLRVLGQRLSIESDCLMDTLLCLDEYDVLVFTHACPHVSDKQKAVANWRNVYRDTTARKITYFSDAFVQDYYPWIKDVQGNFEPVAINQSAGRHAERFLGEPVRVVRHPFVFDAKAAVPDKDDLVVWTSAWRSWKGIRKFVDAVPDITARVELYGTGRELHSFKKESRNGWPGVLMGARHPDMIEDAYQRAKASVDLTGQSRKYEGHYNRTHLEPMLHGCVSVCLPTVVDPHSFIPQGAVWTVGGKGIAAGINELLRDNVQREFIAAQAKQWATRYFAPLNVMGDLLGKP